MTAYKVHALSDSSDYRPDGDGYAPQIMLTGYRYSWDAQELNNSTVPITANELISAHDLLGRNNELTARWARIVTGCNVIAVTSTGFSQGDYGVTFVFETPEWLRMTGAPGIFPSDANDLSRWVWGDVYKVYELDKDEDDNLFIIYGMDEAMKYGEIVYPRTVSYEVWDD